MKGQVLSAAVLMACLAANAAAQEPLTLEQAIALGLKQSARLAELEARKAGAEAAEAGRAAAKMPTVSAQAGYTRTNHVDEFVIATPGQPPRALYPDVPDNYRTRLDLQWPIYSGGRTDALERAARAEVNATAEDLATARADLVLEITRAYWALVTARETEAVLARSLQSLDAHVRDLEARLQQGLIPPNDVLTAQAQRSRQQGLAIEAANTRGVAEADLRRLTGLPRNQGLSLAPAALAAGQPQQARSDVPAPERAERRALGQRLTAARGKMRGFGRA
jgi:outer membrane protein